ncbi:MAG: bifunctional phosphoribosylaminoimidazolecarboxamide formyltransferase/IMP cyclohydrolase [Acidimicrobiales bacterium]|nr:bifunctional phosphoribosylaminoimidazolecarboxamide formyltransferase/IMP cyclohydrolase [Acidimicrobiales bacterium]
MRALLSVFDKTGITDLAAEFHSLGVELISSGGTAAAISGAGIPVTDVADFTGVKPMLGHRVVTLHPYVHGGLLADRRDPTHLTDMENNGIEFIDIVVGNLYPFNTDPSIELIDIGGPAMIRAGAKNHAFVTVLVDPGDYPAVIKELKEKGETKAATRRRLARKAFAHSAVYDAAIVEWLDGQTSTVLDDETPRPLPDLVPVGLTKAADLRYGENPHQAGARYSVNGKPSWWDSVIQHAGVDLSYLNIFDADAAWSLANNLSPDEPTVAIIKHGNPCGVAVASTLAAAYEQAFACDPRSAFGGIVALNRPIDDTTVEAMEAAAQADVVIAPGYEPGVIDRLIAKRKNTRLLEASATTNRRFHVRQLSDSFLLQDHPELRSQPDEWKVVTDRAPTPLELLDAEVAWRVCAAVGSNAIVMVKNRTAFGIGAGQQNRVESSMLAATKADGRAKGGAAASDAFFPFRDGVDAAADAGVAVVVQPGGSINDSDVIAAANERNVAMIFTGERQFRH